MTVSLRTSSIRLIIGATLAVAGLAVLILVLPDASHKLGQRQRAATQARGSLDRARAELEAAQAESRRLQVNRAAMEELMGHLPAESVGQLTWKLSKALYDLSSKHQVHLVAVKYGGPAREGTKGMALESVDVEFTTTGVYTNQKAFMLALEASKLPFAVVSAKMDESPEGAHLTIVLRAFRQLTGAAAQATASGENA
jgi:hypothetical protein